MNIKIEALEKRHVDAILPRMPDRHASVTRAMQNNANYAAMVREVGPAAAFVVDGVVMALAGLVDFTPTDRCIVWCAFATDAGKCFKQLYYCMMRTMRIFPRRRYEAHIDPEFINGKRLVKAAKFRYECTMDCFNSDGSPSELWALVDRKRITA